VFVVGVLDEPACFLTHELLNNLQVSNHVASVDDPFVIASLLPPKFLLDARNLRWTLCATDRCFKNPVTSAFSRSVKVLPISRGEGIYQQVTQAVFVASFS
jgi:1-acyl-sn-glycerol-3-phosphate acyltransferase